MKLSPKVRGLMGAGGISIQSVFGSYVYMTVIYCQSYLCQVRGITPAQFMVFFSFYTAGSFLANLINTQLLKRLPLKTIATIGAFGPAIALIGLRFAPNLPAIYALGLIGGTAMNITGIVLNGVVMSTWFNRGRGKVVGFCQSGRNICGMLIAPTIAAIISSQGALNALMIIGIGFTAVDLICAIFLIQNDPSYYGLEPLNLEFKTKERKKVVVTGYESAMPFKKLFTMPVTYVYLVIVVLTGIAGSMHTANQSTLQQNLFGVELMQVSYNSSMCSFCMMFFNILFGMLVDRFGFKKCFAVAFGWVAVAYALIPSLVTGAIGSIIFCLCVMIYQTQMYLPSLFCPGVFGAKKSASLQPYIGLVSGAVGIVAPLISAAILSSSANPYRGITFAMSGAFALAAILVLVVGSKKSLESFKMADAPYLAEAAGKE